MVGSSMVSFAIKGSSKIPGRMASCGVPTVRIMHFSCALAPWCQGCSAIEDWMVANPHGTKVKRQDVAQWVWTAWLRVSQSTILNTWNAVGYIASD